MELCSRATEFVPPERGTAPAAAVALPPGSGRLWGIPVCTTYAGAHTYDVWYCVANCRTFDDRKAALAGAAAAVAASPRFEHLEPAY